MTECLARDVSELTFDIWEACIIWVRMLDLDCFAASAREPTLERRSATSCMIFMGEWMARSGKLMKKDWGKWVC